nr:MAG TPA: hypothetical protein [Crassvirales sp.]
MVMVFRKQMEILILYIKMVKRLIQIITMFS